MLAARAEVDADEEEEDGEEDEGEDDEPHDDAEHDVLTQELRVCNDITMHSSRLVLNHLYTDGIMHSFKCVFDMTTLSFKLSPSAFVSEFCICC